MFTTPEKVTELTGYTVNEDMLSQAQGIMEIIVGRVEEDIFNANDLAIMGRATAYQAAYMTKNYETVYEQVAVTMMGQTDGTISLDVSMLSPYVAPLALLATRNLSWRKGRSVRTGAIHGAAPLVDEWVTT